MITPNLIHTIFALQNAFQFSLVIFSRYAFLASLYAFSAFSLLLIKSVIIITLTFLSFVLVCHHQSRATIPRLTPAGVSAIFLYILHISWCVAISTKESEQNIFLLRFLFLRLSFPSRFRMPLKKSYPSFLCPSYLCTSLSFLASLLSTKRLPPS